MSTYTIPHVKRKPSESQSVIMTAHPSPSSELQPIRFNNIRDLINGYWRGAFASAHDSPFADNERMARAAVNPIIRPDG